MNPESKQSIAQVVIKALLCAGFSVFYIFLVMIIGTTILHDGAGPDDGLGMLLGIAGSLTSPVAFFTSWKIYKFRIGKAVVVTSVVAIVLLLLSPLFIN